MSWQPEEIYLYPLYVRPLTGLGRRQREWNDDRLAAYRAGRDYLLENGYEQVSMRMFRRADVRSADGPEYCCQTDGMVGLGCGARSYTTSLHYSTEYAVGRSGVKAIVEDYIQRDAASFAAARHGFVLSDEEQRRRFLLVSLLQSTGLSRAQYGQQFDDDPLDDFPALAELESAGLMRVNSDVLRLTDDGLELSDAIGPWLYSASVQQLMEAYELN